MLMSTSFVSMGKPRGGKAQGLLRRFAASCVILVPSLMVIGNLVPVTSANSKRNFLDGYGSDLWGSRESSATIYRNVTCCDESPLEDDFEPLMEANRRVLSADFDFSMLAMLTEGSGVDGKALVDASFSKSLSLISQDFVSQTTPEDRIGAFVEANFQIPGTYLKPWTPTDIVTDVNLLPLFFGRDNSPLTTSDKDILRHVLNLWKSLGRQKSDRRPVVVSPIEASRQSISTDKLQRLGISILDTLIPPENGFIIPGGRFKESYYWDSYWIIRGLLMSGMYDSAKGILLNFCTQIDTLGIIPNGSRTYLLSRSQPPLFASMVWMYYLHTRDIDFLEAALPRLIKEQQYWNSYSSGHGVKLHRAPDGMETYQVPQDVSAWYSFETVSEAEWESLSTEDYYLVSRYYSDLRKPRPESALADLKVGLEIRQYSKRDYFYKNVRAAVESGWDFSTRWLPDELFYDADGMPIPPLVSNLSTNSCSRSTAAKRQSISDRNNINRIDTQNVIPVDLNAILAENDHIISKIAQIILHRPGHPLPWMINRVQLELIMVEHEKKAINRREAISRLMFDNTNNHFADYLLVEIRQSRHVTPAILFPLLFGDFAFNDSSIEKIINHFINDSGLWGECGILTSLFSSGHQWDGEHSFPPLVQVVLESILYRTSINPNSSLRDAKAKLIEFVEKQLSAIKVNLAGTGGYLYEKYNANICGNPGSGGEYANQQGFGWTAGYAFELVVYKHFNYDYARIKNFLYPRI